MLIEASFTAFLATALAAVAIHDFRHMRVPDHFTIAIAMAGTLYWALTSSGLVGPQLFSGATFGGAIWMLRMAHQGFTGRIGLGMGDVKLSAAGAIWLNPVLLPLFLFTASLAGLAFASALTVAEGGNLRQKCIPFAPFLGASIMFCWLLERWP